MLTDSQEPAVLAPSAPAGDPFPAIRGWNSAVLQARQLVDRFRAVLATIASSFGIFGLTAIQGILLARLLAPAGRGEYATGIFYTQTLLYVGLLGSLVSIARRAARLDRPAAELRSAALRLGLCTGTVTAAVVSLLAILALPEAKRGLAPLCIGCALLLPFEQMRLALLSVDHGTAAFRRYNTTRLLAAALFPALLIVAWLIGWISVTVAALLTVAASFLGLLVHIVAVGGPAGFQRSPLTVRTLVGEGLPYAPGIIVGNLFSRIDIFLILWLTDVTVQGLYAAAVPAATLMMVSANALELFAFNAGARTHAAATGSRLRRAAAAVLAIQVSGLVAFLLFLEPLVMLVFGPEFSGTIPYARVLLPAYALCGCGVVAEGYLRGRGRTAISVWARAVGALAMLAVVLVSFDRWGPIGIPWGAVAGHGAVVLCMGWGLVLETRSAARRSDAEIFANGRPRSPVRASQQPSRGIRAALACNFIPPYGVPSYQAIADRLERFTLLVSTPMEENRTWQAQWGDLDVRIQSTWTLRRLWKHPAGFNEPYSLHLPWDTIAMLTRLQPDIVISGELGLRSLLAAVYCRTRRNIPLVIWATLSEHTELSRGRLRRWVRKVILRAADCVIVNGASGARYIASYGFAPERIFAIPYIAIPDVFASCSLERTEAAAHRLISVGQLTERKGLVPFLRQLARWSTEHPERTIEYVVVGSGPLRHILESLKLPPNLHLRLVGEQCYAELPGWYAAAGIFAFPTLADEWGLVVNEALEAGLPVLGSLYSQAVEELCRDGHNGWTFRPDCDAEIYRAIDRALSATTEQLNSMRAAARTAVTAARPDIAAEQFICVLHEAFAWRSRQRQHGTLAARLKRRFRLSAAGWKGSA